MIAIRLMVSQALNKKRKTKERKMNKDSIYTIVDTWEVSSDAPDFSMFNYVKREDALKAFKAILRRAKVLKKGKAYGYASDGKLEVYDVEELFNGMVEEGWCGFKYGNDGDSIVYVRCRPILQKYVATDFSYD